MGWLDKYSDKAEDGKKVNQIGEVTVYSKRKYQDELKKQQEQYLADMTKYKQDSTQWVKANVAYQDSLNLHTDSYNNLKAGANHFHLRQYAGKPRSEYPFALESDRYKSMDEYRKDKTKLLSKSEIEKEIKRYGERDYKYVKKGYADLDWFLSDKIPEGEAIAINKISGKNPDYETYNKEFLEPFIKRNTIKGNIPDFLMGVESDAIPLFIEPKNKPISPNKPEFKPSINYNPKYENLQMRSLWANLAKADSTAKIGVLNPLEYNDDAKGFTINEAINFPQEIKDKYNIDYIGKQIGIKKNGGIIRKAKDGEKMQKLINFTKPTASRWLDKY